jgi:hypothetical protein
MNDALVGVARFDLGQKLRGTDPIDGRGFDKSQKQFANAILAFMRETIPQEWTKFRDKVSDNFRVITHENFRVLE